MEKQNKGKKKKSKAVKWIIILVVLVAVIGCGVGACMHFIKETVQVPQAPVSAQEYVLHDMSDYVTTEGVVVSKNIDVVTTTLPYPIKTVEVELGDSVKKGDVLCEIDTTEIDKNISKLEEQASDSDRLQAKQLEMSNHALQNAGRSQNAAIASAAKAVENARRAYTNAAKGRDALESVYDLALEEYKKQEEIYKALKAELEAEGVTTASLTDAMKTEQTALEVEVMKAKEDLEELGNTVASYASDIASIDQMKTAYDTAVDNYNELVASSGEGLQNARDQLELQKIQAGGYSEMAALLAAAYEERGNSIIRAEQDGLVTDIKAIEGMPVQGNIMQLEDDKNLRVEVSIKEMDILKIQEGQEVRISSDTIDSIGAKGVVSKVYRFKANEEAASGGVGRYAAVADANGSVGYRAVIDVTENNGLMLGMTAKVEIVVDEIGDRLSVPYTSIIDEGSAKYVYVAKPAAEPGSYTAVKTPVEIGENGVYYTEIVSGLEQRDIVITYPEEVVEGTPITVIVKKNRDGSDNDEAEDE